MGQSAHNRPRLNVIYLVAFVDLIPFGLIIPLQADYAKRLGASGLVFGCLVAAYSVAQFLASPMLGRWSDRIGRRPVLLCCMVGSILAHVLLGVADIAGSLGLMFVARLIDGVTGGNIATAQAYIADVTPPEERARGMGLFGAAFGLGFVVGPGLGALLYHVGDQVSRIGTAWPAFGAAALSACAFLLVWLRLPETVSRESQSRHAADRVFSFRRLLDGMHEPRIRTLLLLNFGVAFSFVFLEVSFVYLLKGHFNMTPRGIGLTFGYIGLVMVLVQGGLVGPVTKRFGELRIVAAAPFITALGFLLISGVLRLPGTTVGLVYLVLASVPTALGNGFTGPCLNSLLSREAAQGAQGRTLGLGQGVASLARATSPVLGGLLFDWRPEGPYWVGALLLVICGLYARTLRRGRIAGG